MVAAAGAAVLALSVYQPWYSLALTADGAAQAQSAFNSAAQQFGNAQLQSQASSLSSRFGALTGQEITTLSANQALKYLHVVLLILAAIAFLAAVRRLVATAHPIQADGDQTVLLIGVLAGLCVLYRMVAPPTTVEEVFTLSLSWGIWLALASCAAIVIGGALSRRAARSGASSDGMEDNWKNLSGWTPQA